MFALYSLGYPSSFLNSSETKFLNHKIRKTCFTCRWNTSDGINKKYCSKFGIALAWSICILSKSFNFRKVSWIPWAQRHLCSKAFLWQGILFLPHLLTLDEKRIPGIWFLCRWRCMSLTESMWFFHNHLPASRETSLTTQETGSGTKWKGEAKKCMHENKS